MNKLKLLLLLFSPLACMAQVAIAPGTTIAATEVSSVKLNLKGDVRLPATSGATDLSRWDFTLSGGKQNFTALAPATIGSLEVASGSNVGDKIISGNLTVSNQLKLTKGNLLISKATVLPGKLTYSGTSQLKGDSASYVNGSMYIRTTEGNAYFPIGNADGYFPVQLVDISGEGTMAMEVISENAGISALPGLKEFFTGRYWHFASEGSFAEAKVNVSLRDKSIKNKDMKDFFSTGGGGDPKIAVVSKNGTLASLGGSSNADFVLSDLPITPSVEKIAIAKSEVVTVRITRFITPNGRDDKNNVLYIQNIDLFPENTVTLIDRWGVPIKQWKNFKNYDTSDFNQTGDFAFDFSSLGTGNYICMLEYKDAEGKKQKESQMITVVK